MNTHASQARHDEPGRIELLNNVGRKLPVNLTHPLADGSRLTDPANARLLDTIAGVTAAPQARLSGHSFSAIIGGLYLLVQWMFLRSIHSFGSLRPQHFTAFLVDSSKGVDACIQATPRMIAHLRALPKMSTKERKRLTCWTLFEQAGIPPTYMPRLPQVTSIAKAFIASGPDSLASAPVLPLAAQLTKDTLRSRANAICLLWDHRDSLPDPISVEPFKSNLAALIDKLGKESQQTEIIPVALALRMFVGCVHIVMSIGPSFLEWRDAHADPQKRAKEGLALFDGVRSLVKEHWGRDIVTGAMKRRPLAIPAVSINKALIPLACQLNIYAYVGRRRIEVESLESNCIKGTEEEGRHLAAYIAKRQSHESRPCPELVARSVQLMNRYHGDTPNEPKQLFRQHGKTVRMRNESRLDFLAEVVGALRYVDADGKDQVWHWKAHQLRRLYAVIYIWRYDDASYLALRHHLGHGSDREAAYYAKLASDGNFAELMKEAGIFTLERLRAMASDRTPLKGTYGKVISKRIERLRSVLEVSTPQSLDAILVHLVDGEGLTLHASLWGYCGCKSTASNLKRAKCRQGSRSEAPRHPIFGTPIVEDSEEETCGSCHFHATDKSREPRWRGTVERLNAAVDGGPPGSMAVNMMRLRRDKVHAAAERFFG